MSRGTRHSPWTGPATLVPVLLALCTGAAPGVAQQPDRQTSDSASTLTADVRHDGEPVSDAIVRSGSVGSRTDQTGRAVLRLAAGAHVVIVSRIGFAPETLRLSLAAGADTLVMVELEEESHELEQVIVSATRSERRIDDVPLRVEVIGGEEIEEKVFMTPGDIAMMLNETSGLRVQTTSPSLGGASVRIQGLRGRYTQILSDGLPLYGGQTGGLGLLQIPPMDLGQVEVIKGAASALYGASALGGVINLVSRRPGDEHERELLLNQTTRGGSDGVLWLSGPMAEQWSYTMLGGVHYQDARDVDGDVWVDLPGYSRVVARPRVFWQGSNGRSLLLTSGLTIESREGGTLGDRAMESGLRYVEALDTRRGDIGGAGQLLLGNSILRVRGSATEQRHEHRFGDVREEDRHGTWFAEASLTVPLSRTSWVLGAAMQRDRYVNHSVPGFDFAYSIPSIFAQLDADPAPWLAISASARLDAHSEYGALINPRLSVLLRAPASEALAGWSVRASAGTGAFAPTPFTEETEVVGLSVLEPLDDPDVERAITGSIDVSGPVGPVELVATVFASAIEDPVDEIAATGGAERLRLVNAPGPTRTAGAELLGRFVEEPWHVTASYAFTRSTEEPADVVGRHVVPLVPRHTLGVVGMYEVEGRGRVGVEVYYTGRQVLDDNPYRDASRPHVILGALVEHRFGPARLFINFENITDVRQTRWDPLVRPTPGPGGRWTTDAWTELSGRTINGGVRLEL